MLEKIKEYFKNDTIQIALVSGLSIIVTALFYKYVLHTEINGVLIAIPGFIAMMHGSLSMSDKKKKKKKKPIDPKYLRPLYWNLAITIMTIISLAVPYFNR